MIVAVATAVTVFIKRLRPFVARRASTQKLQASLEHECWQARRSFVVAAARTC